MHITLWLSFAMKEKTKKHSARVIHHKHGLRNRRRCCRTAKYSRYQADSNPRPRRFWPDHGPQGVQGSYPTLCYEYVTLRGSVVCRKYAVGASGYPFATEATVRMSRDRSPLIKICFTVKKERKLSDAVRIFHSS